MLVVELRRLGRFKFLCMERRRGVESISEADSGDVRARSRELGHYLIEALPWQRVAEVHNPTRKAYDSGGY